MNEKKTNHSSLEERLVAFARKIQNPLSAIVALNKIGETDSNTQPGESTSIIFENSRIIAGLIEDLVSVNEHKVPLIFTLYNTVPAVQQICTKEICPASVSKPDQEWLHTLEKVVFEIINRTKINLTKLAFEVYVSERQLHRNTMKFVGLTPNNYIRVLKLHRAKEYLENYTYKTISEVSNAVGFNDSYYFCKVFHNQYGILPKNLLPA